METETVSQVEGVEPSRSLTRRTRVRTRRKAKDPKRDRRLAISPQQKIVLAVLIAIGVALTVFIIAIASEPIGGGSSVITHRSG